VSAHHHELPLWALWVQFFATILIAAAAAFIGYRQWQTAHERIVLDLFERRMKIYDETASLIADVMRTGRVTRQHCEEFAGTIFHMSFLFGDDLDVYCKSVLSTLQRLERDQGAISQDNPSFDRTKLIDREDSDMELIRRFPKRFHDLITPYVRLEQRVTGRPMSIGQALRAAKARLLT
jgi:hypothetical protein